jgi:hypothetical protein
MNQFEFPESDPDYEEKPVSASKADSLFCSGFRCHRSFGNDCSVVAFEQKPELATHE